MKKVLEEVRWERRSVQRSAKYSTSLACAGDYTLADRNTEDE